MWPLAVLVLSIALTFSPVLLADYLGLDDPTHITGNPGLQQVSGHGLLGFWTQSYFSLYIPVTYSLWWLLSSVAHLFGPLRQTAWIFHATNVLVHLANTYLVFLTVRQLLLLRQDKRPFPPDTRPSSIALLAALFFGLHPAQVETVAWISECKGVLSTFFALLGLWTYYSRSKKSATVVAFVLAMLSKPTAIVAPGILFLVDRVVVRRSLKESALVPSVTCLLLLPLVVVTKHLQPDLNIDFLPTLLQRIYIAIDALGFYVSTLFAPVSLALDYGRSPEYVLAHVHSWHPAISILVMLVALAIPAEAICRDRPRSVWYSFVACGWSVFVLSLLPVLGLIPFKFQLYSTVADRYMYVPVFGAALALAGVLSRCRADRKSLAIMVVLLLLLAGLSFNQATKWHSTETLFAHTFRMNPRSYLGHYSIARELFDRGRSEEGIAQALKAVEIKPDYLPAHLSIGLAWIRQGEIKTGIDYYSSVLARDLTTVRKQGPLLAAIHHNIGLALWQVGRRAEGIEHLRKAVELDPISVSGHLSLGDAALEDGQYLEAVLQYEHALALRPGDGSVEQRLARARREVRRTLLDRSR